MKLLIMTFLNFLPKKTGRLWLSYQIRENSWLSMEVEKYKILIGIFCHKKSYPEEFEKIKEVFPGIARNWNPKGNTRNWWPVGQHDNGQYEYGDVILMHPTPEVLGMLLDKAKRREFASGIAKQAKEYWDGMDSAGLIKFKKQHPPL